MRVKMLTSAPGSPDGVTVNEYDKGQVYEVTEDLGNVLLSEGLAVLDVPAPVEVKKAAPAENKQDAGPSEDK